MKTVEMTKSNTSLAEYIHGLTSEPLIITVNGKPVAALISIENMDLETTALSADTEFMEIIERSRTRYRKDGGISGKDMKGKFNLSD